MHKQATTGRGRGRELPGSCSMRGQRKSTLVDRHAPEAIATAVTVSCASVDATAACPARRFPAAAAAAMTSRPPGARPTPPRAAGPRARARTPAASAPGPGAAPAPPPPTGASPRAGRASRRQRRTWTPPAMASCDGAVSISSLTRGGGRGGGWGEVRSRGGVRPVFLWMWLVTGRLGQQRRLLLLLGWLWLPSCVVLSRPHGLSRFSHLSFPVIVA